ncbi:MAG TPA: tetratricopeptide repeat protein [Pyrinomonadaceae bacterium]|nr:tetratricopeptide repeat protein [Pyrinomonadaceae bacterium]
MVQSKIEIFTAMLAEQPENAMIWYGLAGEQYKMEKWAEAAKSLRQVVSLNPDYTAAYQMLGTVLAHVGDLAGAQQAWRDGIDAADRTGAWKAGQHMRVLLAGVAGADEALPDQGTEMPVENS